MADTFITYRSFNDKAFAVELFNKLKGEGIPVVWEDSERYFDVSFSYNEMLNMYYIKLRQDDFKKADDILSRLVKEDSGKISDDYYLYSFSDDELKDILKKPDGHFIDAGNGAPDPLNRVAEDFFYDDRFAGITHGDPIGAGVIAPAR